jgi:hypothetical protein
MIKKCLGTIHSCTVTGAQALLVAHIQPLPAPGLTLLEINKGRKDDAQNRLNSYT